MYAQNPSATTNIFLSIRISYENKRELREGSHVQRPRLKTQQKSI